MDDITKRINRRVGQLVNKADRDIAKEYAQFMKDLRQLIGGYYEKFESGGELTYEEMAKYDRLNKLYKQVHGMSKQTYKGAEKVLETVLSEVYQEGYYLTGYGLEQEAQKYLKYSGVRPEVIVAALNNPISGLTLNDLMEKNRMEIEYKIRTTVNQGLVKGETYGTMAKNLKETLNGDYKKSMRVVRTEAHRVSEQGKQDSRDHAEASGIVITKTWRTMEDERVRSTHKHLDGVTINNDERFVSGGGEALYPGDFGIASEDINCRCLILQEVKEIKNANLQDIKEQTYEDFMEGVEG